MVMSSRDIKQNVVLLPTASIYIYNAEDSPYLVKTILDSGSQSNFISQDLCRKLKLKQIPIGISVAGINNKISSLTHKCQVRVKSRCNNFTTSLTCLILINITEQLPVTPINTDTWNIPTTITLADPNFHEPTDVDLLIGASHFWEILKQGQIQLGKHLPILQNTNFGWVISGHLPKHTPKLHCHFSQIQLFDDFKKFWEIEEVSTSSTGLTSDDTDCERFFKETVTRTREGRFVVRIPLKHQSSNLGSSKEGAVKRMLQLERRFLSHPEFKRDYVNFMNEYISLNHMTKLNSSDQDFKNRYYLPHHGVLKHTSLTTKLRVVFNGSAPSTSGWSVNDLQYIGPPVHTELVSILLRFRQYPIAVSADIEKMYRQIIIHQDDRYLQNIVWRPDSDHELSSYSLNTVTYGTASAPYLAIRCLKQLAYEIKESQPTISNIIDNQFYVDDLIASFETEQEAISSCKAVTNVLQNACFSLRKWASNSSSFLDAIKSDSDSVNVVTFPDDKQLRTLGVIWESNTDTFSYQISNLPQSLPITKRLILSEISKVFDPLGFLSPCTILIKILIQKLWNLKLNWDAEIPSEFQRKWFHFKRQIHILNNITITRPVVCRNPISVELHGFCDSSSKAYAAVVYVRSVDENETKHVHLLCAKTKVAPIKLITIPRLELCGALLLTRLINKVKQSLTLKVKYTLWCDSQVVLNWIRTASNQLNVFVGNRVSEIQECTNPTSWSYVNTRENPADLASRGIYPKVLEGSEMWWHGPHWLSLPSSNWPKQLFEYTMSDIPELKKKCFVSTQCNVSFPFNKFSNLTKLKRVMSYCLRFINNSRLSPNKRRFDQITTQELDRATNQLVKIAQNEDFSQEISSLQENKPLSKSRLQSLSPFLDNNNLLKVGGRLRHSNLEFQTKHPLLLNGKHRLAILIAEYFHKSLLHAGPQLVLATIRQKFWLTSGMSLVKKVTRSCIKCFRLKPLSINPIMADLPKERVSITNAFNIVGVDYAGPFLLRDKRGRGSKPIKGYVRLFICFVSKAIHLELVTDLTTDSFIASLRRFISRRGKPSQIWSDNGTNFVGSQHKLHDLFKFFKLNENSIIDCSAQEGISWKFIPPNSPHFGGLWEAGVKSVKFHINRTLKESKLTFEDFYTVLTQIEAILNSRPLYPLSSDPNDHQPLTPSHFLIGRPLTSLPDVNVQHIPINRLSRFQFLQHLYQTFWRRWSKEYLSVLQHRSKWRSQTKSIKAGTLVLVKQDNLPPNYWLLGRIVEVFPDSEGVVRVATIKTVKGVIKRAVTKLCPLPILDNLDSEQVSTDNSET